MINFLNTWGVIIFSVSAVLYLLAAKKKLQAFETALSCILSGATTMVLKELFFTPRPYVVNARDALAGHATTASFPSMHATLAFSVAVAILMYNRIWGYAALLVAVLISAGRVAANVHYVWDIAAGALVGILVTIFVVRVYPASFSKNRRG